MAWTHQAIRLYHGTTSTAAASIITAGIQLSYCSLFTDFGRGFYTTTSVAQAKRWARILCWVNPTLSPAVISFDVDRLRLGQCEHLFFTHHDDRRTKFWQFVKYCRSGRSPHVPGRRDYAVVSGPVASWPPPSWSTKHVLRDLDQVSFHQTQGAPLDRPDASINALLGTGRLVPTPRRTARPAGQFDPGGGYREAFEKALAAAMKTVSRWTAPRRNAPDGTAQDVDALLARIQRLAEHDTLLYHFDPRHLACVASRVTFPSRELERELTAEGEASASARGHRPPLTKRAGLG